MISSSGVACQQQQVERQKQIVPLELVAKKDTVGGPSLSFRAGAIVSVEWSSVAKVPTPSSPMKCTIKP